MPFAQERIGFNEPPKLFLNKTKKMLATSGENRVYDPAEKSVTLYVTGRHPKDVLRSLGHELVHHKQIVMEIRKCRGYGRGIRSKKPHLRQMEIEANSVGSMCLRDFEDGLREQKTIYYEHLQKGEKTMSMKDWKNKEINDTFVGSMGL